ncbi:MAG: dephospho-CoA kinase [Leptospirales bacterium]|nr:dephospho-CoA kinase [Leptospirales bacterium]
MRYPQLPVIRWRRPYFLVGLSGGIGAGKSAAREAFAREGFQTLDADLLAREALHSEELRGALLAAFGQRIVDAEGRINRATLAEIVFLDTGRREQLNALVHPAVEKAFEQARQLLRPGEALVYEVPLLFEKGRQADFDLTVTITAPAELRFARAASRNGWSREEFEQREAAQLPLAEKEARADLCIENSGSPEQLQQAITALAAAIRKAAPQART